MPLGAKGREVYAKRGYEKRISLLRYVLKWSEGDSPSLLAVENFAPSWRPFAPKGIITGRFAEAEVSKSQTRRRSAGDGAAMSVSLGMLLADDAEIVPPPRKTHPCYGVRFGSKA